MFYVVFINQLQTFLLLPNPTCPFLAYIFVCMMSIHFYFSLFPYLSRTLHLWTVIILSSVSKRDINQLTPRSCKGDCGKHFLIPFKFISRVEVPHMLCHIESLPILDTIYGTPSGMENTYPWFHTNLLQRGNQSYTNLVFI